MVVFRSSVRSPKGKNDRNDSPEPIRDSKAWEKIMNGKGPKGTGSDGTEAKFEGHGVQPQKESQKWGCHHPNWGLILDVWSSNIGKLMCDRQQTQPTVGVLERICGWRG